MGEVKPGDVYTAEVVVPKAAAADTTILGPEVPEGRVVRIDTFYVIDLTTSAKTIELGYRRRGTNYWFKRAAAGTGVYGVSQDRPIVLVEGEQLVGKVESASASDECWLIARGIYL